jgi:hypothetical protein
MAKLLFILFLGWAVIVEVAPEPEPPLLIDAPQPSAN